MSTRLTDFKEIEQTVYGRVVRMLSRGKETIEFLDEVDAYDIAYDATKTGGVDVYVDDKGKLRVTYRFVPCVLTEIDATNTLRELAQLEALCRRSPSVHVEDSTYNEAKNQYGITLSHPVLGREAYSFDGLHYWRNTESDGFTILPDFDIMLRYVYAYTQLASATI